ncbi:hypothetical protein XAC1153 [Xanthomonas citri pv. citri str. 306]|uniref:Uncharacterized protein n=1 Tax=Xanthomonas axonopodis pv. citri (strain 306) TaxID=190486 RepID=A0AAI8ES16_XANAC|nr:hypothetical protein XAC1153 [Xanthomonas citri pv. citri str. 306]
MARHIWSDALFLSSWSHYVQYHRLDSIQDSPSGRVDSLSCLLRFYGREGARSAGGSGILIELMITLRGSQTLTPAPLPKERGWPPSPAPAEPAAKTRRCGSTSTASALSARGLTQPLRAQS